jgi:hypothetical protein
MKLRVLLIAFMILALAGFSSAPRANAEPLTIIAIVGIVTVLSTSSIDMVARSNEDNKDQHAQQEDAGKMHAKAEKTEDASSLSQGAVVARQN